MTFFIVLWAFILLSVVALAVFFWMTRPVRRVSVEELPPVAIYRRHTSHHYRMRLPDRLRLELHGQDDE